jgi:hypothetical protein
MEGVLFLNISSSNLKEAVTEKMGAAGVMMLCYGVFKLKSHNQFPHSNTITITGNSNGRSFF